MHLPIIWNILPKLQWRICWINITSQLSRPARGSSMKVMGWGTICVPSYGARTWQHIDRFKSPVPWPRTPLPIQAEVLPLNWVLCRIIVSREAGYLHGMWGQGSSCGLIVHILGSQQNMSLRHLASLIPYRGIHQPGLITALIFRTR